MDDARRVADDLLLELVAEPRVADEVDLAEEQERRGRLIGFRATGRRPGPVGLHEHEHEQQDGEGRQRRGDLRNLEPIAVNPSRGVARPPHPAVEVQARRHDEHDQKDRDERHRITGWGTLFRK